MGMAASQARFLGITARKTNTEYEGQQVNQQRTALANQSANLFNQLLGLNVPTPPSKSDAKYTKTVYSFTDDTGATATITSITNNPDSSTVDLWPKIVSYTTPQIKNVSRRASLLSATPKNVEDTATGLHKNYLKVGSAELAQVSEIKIDKSKSDADKAAKQNIYKAIYDDVYGKSTKTTEDEKIAEATAAAVAGTNNLYKVKDGTDYKYINVPSIAPGGSADAYFYSKDGDKEATASTISNDGGTYKVNIGGAAKELEQIQTKFAAGTIQLSGTPDIKALGDVDISTLNFLQDTYASLQSQDTFYKYTINGVNYYAPKTDIKGEFNTDTFGVDKSVDPFGYYIAEEQHNEPKEFKARVNYDTSGRLQSIVLKEGVNELDFNVSVNSITDEDKYENDFNQYKYEMAQYEKTVEDINAKTEAIQAQDRTLELRLKQLDTEQEALTQEMDAIKKVIDKNVETTFKTFA